MELEGDSMYIALFVSNIFHLQGETDERKWTQRL